MPMEYTVCKICGEKTKLVFRAKVLNKYDASYFQCEHCFFLQPGSPTWLNESYESPINKEDTGYISRNIILARKTFLFLVSFFDRDKRFLDYAAGYGMLVRMMRDMGLDFYWQDKYTDNLFARGFERDRQEISAVTCFECFEHFSEPREEIETMLKISRNIFFSTSLYDAGALGVVPELSWPYYGFSHGQHIAFYSLKTLECLADQYGLHLYSNGRDLHFLSDRRIGQWRFLLILKLGRILPWDMLSRLILKSRAPEDALRISQDKYSK